VLGRAEPHFRPGGCCLFGLQPLAYLYVTNFTGSPEDCRPLLQLCPALLGLILCCKFFYCTIFTGSRLLQASVGAAFDLWRLASSTCYKFYRFQTLSSYPPWASHGWLCLWLWAMSVAWASHGWLHGCLCLYVITIYCVGGMRNIQILGCASPSLPNLFHSHYLISGMLTPLSDITTSTLDILGGGGRGVGVGGQLSVELVRV